MDIVALFTYATPVIYWLLILAWSYIFIFYLIKIKIIKSSNKLLRVLLLILAIDAFRSLFESIYFGAWYTSLSGIIPIEIFNYLAQPQIVFFPKIFNLITTILILTLLIRKWLKLEINKKNEFNKLINEKNLTLEERNSELLIAKNLLEGNEKLLRLSTELGNIAVWEYDFSSNTMSRSKNHDKLYGIPWQETWNLDTFRNSTHPDDLEVFNTTILNSVSVGGPNEYKFNFRAVYPDKSIHWLAVIGEVVKRNSTGEGILVRGCLVDITDQKNIEQALRESEERYKQIYKYSPDPIVIHDMDMNILEVNNNLSNLFGYSKEELLEMKISDLHPKDETINSIEVLAKMHEKKILPVESKYSKKDGSVFFAETITYKYTLGNKPIIHLVIRDISEHINLVKSTKIAQEETNNLLGIAEKSGQVLLSVIEDERIAREKLNVFNEELEQRVIERTSQLELANKELESFSYSVSHDLRAPLRHINGYINMLTNNFIDSLPEKGRYFLNTIEDSAKEMGILIDDLLNFSRTGRQELLRSNVDMNMIVDGVISTIRNDTNSRKIKWITKSLPFANCDESLIKQVWINLLSNAAKFTQKNNNTIIETGYEENENDFVFYVQDNGVGFDMKYADKLFGVFQRLHTKTEYEGTGIGLANVQNIIQRHGGRVWADAELEKGAIFYFTIPK
jgi:PAS domain S-box-containing protein